MRLWKRSTETTEAEPLLCGSCSGVVWPDSTKLPLGTFEFITKDNGRNIIRQQETGEIVHECPPKRVVFQVSGGSLKVSGLTARGFDSVVESVDCELDIEGLDIE